MRDWNGLVPDLAHTRGDGIVHRSLMATRFGAIGVEVDERGAVTRIQLDCATRTQDPAWHSARGRPCEHVVRQLSEYLDGTRREFELILAPVGTDFQLRVWHEVCRIPYGTTLSYGELARRLGDVTLARAVGAANGANPIPILIPCHRVIGVDGSLVGYGGGLQIKRGLLELEVGAVAGHQAGFDF